MDAIVKDIVDQGYKPVVFIDNDLTKVTSIAEQLREIAKQARKYDIKVIYSTDTTELNRLRKAHVFRYGQIPQITEAMVKRKGGRIVSGSL